MKIIDPETGERVFPKRQPKTGAFGEDMKKINKELRDDDPIMVNAQKEGESEMSPMDPPEAYDKSTAIGLDYEHANHFIQNLVDEHKEVKEELKLFDEALIRFKETHYAFNSEVADAFNKFYTYFDNHILPHNEKEEHYYFRILHKRLIESGEHGNGSEERTAIDVMEDDHIKFIQLGSLSFNLFGLAHRLRDPESRFLTWDLAYNTARELVELLRLHIFREDETLFPLSQQLLTEEDFRIINENA
ncbi:MAG: hemerythrin domain-containing protein [Brumimicrobium sp.]|nr:hemerythrin domain-containing protein [Brumimicrobium sp.]